MPGRARGQRGSAPRPRPRDHYDGAGRRRFRRAPPEGRDPYRRRPHRACGRVHARHAAYALAQAQGRRPADPAPRGLHRPRPARHRTLHRAGLPHNRTRGRRLDARLPGHRIRALQAWPARRPALRAHRRAGPDLEVHRIRRALPDQDGRRRLGQDQGPRQESRQRGRQGTHPPVRRAPADQGPRFWPRHALAARTRRRLPLRRDPRPARHHRRGQGRHGKARPHGPPAHRRRRLRQDRDRRARRLQGHSGRLPGRRPRAHDPAGHPARGNLRRALRRLPRAHRHALALLDPEGNRGGQGGAGLGRG